MKNKVVTIVLSIILFVVPLVIIPRIWGDSYTPKIIVLLIGGFILLVTTLIRIDKLKIDKTDALVLIFGLLAIISTIFSKNVNKSLIGEDNRYEGLFSILTYILIYYNAKYYFENYKEFKTIALIIYMAICIFSIIQFYLKNAITLPTIFSVGAVGTFGNTNFMGSFISIILPILIMEAILENKKIYYICSIIAFCSIVMCIARSAWVAFIVSLILIVIYIIAKHNKEYLKRFLIIGISFILCFTVINYTDKIKNSATKSESNTTEVETKSESNKTVVETKIDKVKSEIKQLMTTGFTNDMGSGRVEIWKLIIKLIQKEPIVGCGIDTIYDGLIKDFPTETVNYIVEHGNYIDKTHNEYLQIAATMGIPALIVYLAFIGTIIIGCIQKSSKSKLITIYGIAIISYVTQAFFNISTIGVAPIFWFILGMASRNININNKKRA